MNTRSMPHPRSFRFAILLTLLGALLRMAPAFAQDKLGDEGFYREAADQNRYLVKAADLVAQAPNMEPRMVHPDQIQATIANLQSKGFCAAPLLGVCPKCQLDAAKEKSCKRPNILIFLVDDMGWGDFQPYGGGVAYGATTPEVTKLAQDGLLLTSTYAQPSCSPTRATIHTGQLPIHHGVLYPPMYGDPGGITANSIPLPMLLKRAGYTTQGVGKWHVGENIPNLPQNVGYDDYYGFLSVSDMYTEWRDQYYNPEVVRDKERTDYMFNNKFSHYLIHASTKPNVPDLIKAKFAHDTHTALGCEALAEITLPWEAAALNADPNAPDNRGISNHCWVAPENKKKRVSIADLDTLWVNYSVNFIEQQKDSGKPWFLYHATRGCHFDNYPTDANHRISYARTIYSDCTVEMDQILGQVRAALDRTGQADDTLIFFTSDNGPENEIPPHGHTPFRGGKGDTWEGGVRVPGIAVWKGMIEPGRVSDGLFDLADLYPTVLELAGIDYAHPNLDPVLKTETEVVKKIEGRYLDGVEQASFLLSDHGASNRRSIQNWYLTNFSGVRMDEYKGYVKVSEDIVTKEGYPGGFSGVDLKASYMLMFNLQEDPKETDNIAIRHLWAQHLFSAEMQRVFCALTKYPPHLPTQPMAELDFMNDINDLLDHPEKYKATCGTLPDKS
ncbi:MAG TPA: sulfatase-like hydrolase/transferase [Thermoanaerobaculia bacterium]|nr:sulfatase-like hydrolase/transferase [Thermoanaerobaculia bacterium]